MYSCIIVFHFIAKLCWAMNTFIQQQLLYNSIFSLKITLSSSQYNYTCTQFSFFVH